MPCIRIIFIQYLAFGLRDLGDIRRTARCRARRSLYFCSQRGGGTNIRHRNFKRNGYNQVAKGGPSIPVIGLLLRIWRAAAVRTLVNNENYCSFHHV